MLWGFWHRSLWECWLSRVRRILRSTRKCYESSGSVWFVEFYARLENAMSVLAHWARIHIAYLLLPLKWRQPSIKDLSKLILLSVNEEASTHLRNNGYFQLTLRIYVGNSILPDIQCTDTNDLCLSNVGRCIYRISAK